MLLLLGVYKEVLDWGLPLVFLESSELWIHEMNIIDYYLFIVMVMLSKGACVDVIFGLDRLLIVPGDAVAISVIQLNKRSES